MKNILLTTREAGRLLGVNASRIRQFILAGRLTAVRRGRDLFLDSAQLERFQKRREAKGLLARGYSRKPPQDPIDKPLIT